MHNAYLLLGSNLGDRSKNLNKALFFIKKDIGRIISISSVYETAPWGFECENMFLNQLVCIETQKSPRKLFSEILKTELIMGRKRKLKNTKKRDLTCLQENRWSDRVIDIDILFYDKIILNEKDLKIPHSSLHQRRFALVPLAEIANNMVHPGLNKTMGQLLEECTDDLEVKLRT